MKISRAIAALLVAALPSLSSAAAPEEAVRAVVKAVAAGEDLAAAFPGAVSAREVASLRRLAGCTAHNLMRQARGDYTVVWACRGDLSLGMEVLLKGGKVSSITTMEVFRRPKLGS